MAKGKEAKDSDLAWVGRHIVDFVAMTPNLTTSPLPLVLGYSTILQKHLASNRLASMRLVHVSIRCRIMLLTWLDDLHTMQDGQTA